VYDHVEEELAVVELAFELGHFFATDLADSVGNFQLGSRHGRSLFFICLFSFFRRENLSHEHIVVIIDLHAYALRVHH